MHLYSHLEDFSGTKLWYWIDVDDSAGWGILQSGSRVQLKRDGTRWRTGEEVKGKKASGVGSQ